MPSANKRTLTGQQRRFCEAYVLSKNGTEAYQKAYPDCARNTARANAARMLASAAIQTEIQKLRDKADHRAGSAVLTLVEKRKFLARLVRVEGANIDEELDGDLINGLKFDRFGHRILVLPDKATAIKIDNDLAGEGSEAKGMSALGALVGRLRK